MNDDLRPDAVDDELSRRFGAGAPADTDPDAVLDTMRPRLQQARTRRRAAFASAIAGMAAVVVVLALVLGSGGGGSGSVRTPPASNSPRPTTQSTPSSTTAPIGGSATPDTVPSAADDHGDDSTTATTPTVPNTSPAAETPPAISPPAPQDESFTSAGGSIVVHLADGVVSLVSNTPAPGYSADVHDNGPTRVEVRFSNGPTEWRIRVDVVNGQLVPEITDHG